MSTTDSPRIRPFADFLAEHNGGQGVAKAGELLHELVQAVRDTGKKGSVTLVVGVDSMDENTLITTVNVTSKVPTAAAKNAIFFADADGNLIKNDPRQQHLPLKEVPGGLAVDELALKEVQ